MGWRSLPNVGYCYPKVFVAQCREQTAEWYPEFFDKMNGALNHKRDKGVFLFTYAGSLPQIDCPSYVEQRRRLTEVLSEVFARPVVPVVEDNLRADGYSIFHDLGRGRGRRKFTFRIPLDQS